MRNIARFSSLFAAGLSAAAVLTLWACSTETIVTQAQPGNDGGPTGDDAGEDAPATPDASPPPDRSVKGTWEKVAVHPADGDPIEALASIFVRGPSDVWASEGASNLGTGYYHYDGK